MANRRVNQAAFAALSLLVLRQMDRAFDRYGQTAKIDALHSSLQRILANGHARAAYMGRSMAGDTSAFDADDRLYGRHAADEEEQWLGPFVEDIRSGAFGPADAFDVVKLSGRAALYARKLRGTANAAFADTLDPDTDLYWTVEDDVEEGNHCETCPYFQAHSPYKAHSRPTDPGLGETDCLTLCHCYWRTADGRECFRAVAL